MRITALSLIGAGALGFAAAALGFSAWSARPASAQFKPGVPTPGFSNLSTNSGSPPAAQPLVIEALDANHFVVAAREPRLVSQIGKEGTAQNMVVTVVTHYTVQDDRLIPVEHVRVPTGYRAIIIEE